MEYKGYTEYTFANDTEMANFYENMGENSLGLISNKNLLLICFKIKTPLLN